VPWVYLRSVLARRWGCRPDEVDAAPWEYTGLELEFLELEGRVAAERERRERVT
jgi:hypothetical protein